MAISNPVHPGDFIRTEIVDAHGLSVTAAAKALGETPTCPVRWHCASKKRSA